MGCTLRLINILCWSVTQETEIPSLIITLFIILIYYPYAYYLLTLTYYY